jgi:diacylglycerol diphosphate phosphatase / phosphatidate phosphatase
MANFVDAYFASFPLVFATTICGSLSLDESHNWYDTLAGAIIGILSALAAYRTRYAAIWDFRFVAVTVEAL